MSLRARERREADQLPDSSAKSQCRHLFEDFGLDFVIFFFSLLSGFAKNSFSFVFCLDDFRCPIVLV